MEVIWLPKAKQRIKQIHAFYRSRSKTVANKLIDDIKVATISLSNFPQMGALELSLSDLTINFRYLVVRENYKVIYYVDDQK